VFPATRRFSREAERPRWAGSRPLRSCSAAERPNVSRYEQSNPTLREVRVETTVRESCPKSCTREARARTRRPSTAAPQTKTTKRRTRRSRPFLFDRERPLTRRRCPERLRAHTRATVWLAARDRTGMLNSTSWVPPMAPLAMMLMLLPSAVHGPRSCRRTSSTLRLVDRELQTVKPEGQAAERPPPHFADLPVTAQDVYFLRPDTAAAKPRRLAAAETYASAVELPGDGRLDR